MERQVKHQLVWSSLDFIFQRRNTYNSCCIPYINICMLKDLIDKRATCYHWLDTPVEQHKIDYIVDCAIGAPSKNAIYPYKLQILTNSPQAIEFKQNLFWNDSWIVGGVRTPQEHKDSTKKRFNGQYLAPVLLLWTRRHQSSVEDDNTRTDEATADAIKGAKQAWNFSGEISQGQKEQVLMDMAVSASFACLSAEEQGLRTGFAQCHSTHWTDTILGEGLIEVDLALGIGYAELDTQEMETVVHWVNKDGELAGRMPKNLPQTFPKDKHFTRRQRPTKDVLVNIL